MGKTTLLIAAMTMAGAAVGAFENEPMVSDSMIDKINTVQGLWTARANYMSQLPRKTVRAMLGFIPEEQVKSEGKSYEETIEYSPAFVATLPENFDSRTEWPECETIKEIRDQKHCGSCWAFGAVEAMSDRMCIHAGYPNLALSAEDMNSCAKQLEVIPCGSCDGGLPGCAWSYWKSHGVVSESCYPYTAGNTTVSHPYSAGFGIPTPACLKKCTGDTSLVWADDKHYSSDHYTAKGEANIMAEIAENGPVEGAFTVYSDFMVYSGGIYKYTTGSQEGGHAIKILGWGVEDGVKYWLCANSWNTSWGEKGFFRILRGTNECGIEAKVWGGIPKEKKSN